LKKRILNYFIWIGLSLFVLWLYRAGLYVGIKKNTSGIYEKLNEIFEGHTNYDAIILGSSRAESQIQPETIDSIFNSNTYNLGIPGSDITHQLAFLKTYLAQHPIPKRLILSIDIYGYTAGNEVSELKDYNRYFPYLNNSVFYSEMKQINKAYFAFKNFVPYSLAFDHHDEMLNNVLRGYFHYSNNTLKYEKGFVIPPELYDKQYQYKMDTVKILSLPSASAWKAYEKINTICESKGIELIIVLIPVHHTLYKKIENEFILRKALRQIFHERPLLDYTHSAFSDTDTLFADAMHLNHIGVMQFNRQLSADMQQFLDKKNVK
jgi:hypothetical protein